mmetsp:Transcript_25108/g.61888  ORF Transcript_25108/g.61888 Transcript_25108/m.61888 type:complete len:230 (+) Transcript_25108:215-904(+)
MPWRTIMLLGLFVVQMCQYPRSHSRPLLSLLEPCKRSLPIHSIQDLISMRLLNVDPVSRMTVTVLQLLTPLWTIILRVPSLVEALPISRNLLWRKRHRFHPYTKNNKNTAQSRITVPLLGSPALDPRVIKMLLPPHPMVVVKKWNAACRRFAKSQKTIVWWRKCNFQNLLQQHQQQQYRTKMCHQRNNNNNKTNFVGERNQIGLPFDDPSHQPMPLLLLLTAALVKMIL